MKDLIGRLALVAGLLALSQGEARADVINFSGLVGVEAPVPNYAGFTWNNFSSLNTLTDANVMPSGYKYANTDSASPNVAFNLYGKPASMTGTSPFTFVGGFFTAAWRDGLNVEVSGSRNGTRLYDTTFTINSTGPTFEFLNFQGIDKLDFVSSGGTAHGYVPLRPLSHPPLTQFAMDDLVFLKTSANPPAHASFAQMSPAFRPVPEPTSLVLLALGAILAGARARWKR